MAFRRHVSPASWFNILTERNLGVENIVRESDGEGRWQQEPSPQACSDRIIRCRAINKHECSKHTFHNPLEWSHPGDPLVPLGCTRKALQPDLSQSPQGAPQGCTRRMRGWGPRTNSDDTGAPPPLSGYNAYPTLHRNCTTCWRASGNIVKLCWHKYHIIRIARSVRTLLGRF